MAVDFRDFRDRAFPFPLKDSALVMPGGLAALPTLGPLATPIDPILNPAIAADMAFRPKEILVSRRGG
jgi:hypothetical protein